RKSSVETKENVCKFKGKNQYNQRGTSITAKESASIIEGVCQEEFSNAIIHAKAKNILSPNSHLKRIVNEEAFFIFSFFICSSFALSLHSDNVSL
ncbi:MAG: hypothetical protein II415_08100, partial [Bacteroidaceae bacterium]|nr:hypothetical protein [Bacteroidaceae bacterium]